VQNTGIASSPAPVLLVLRCVRGTIRIAIAAKARFGYLGFIKRALRP
jgi:hypothetical protein